jgi:hypothetical protein
MLRIRINNPATLIQTIIQSILTTKIVTLPIINPRICVINAKSHGYLGIGANMATLTSWKLKKKS